ncbi:MAG: glycosyltransferase family 2 protein [Gammaproteobacteria bacterium]
MIWLFLISAAGLLYVACVYPLLLGVLTRLTGKAVRREFSPRTVSILVPVHNGAPFLRRKLESILALDYPVDRMEILVVSDGSEDETDQIAQEFAPRGVRWLRVPRGGKAAAINAGCAQLRNEILLLTDVRQPLAPDSLKNLIANFADPATGVVSGELLIVRGETQEEVDIGRYWRFESWIRRSLSHIGSTIGATGPFYAIRRELVVSIPPDVLLDDVYLPLGAFFRGRRLLVDPSARAYDYPTSLHSEFRRKVRTLAGNYQLLRYYPRLMVPNHGLWFHFVSYKLGRLVLPFGLIALGVSSVGLPKPWQEIALGMQAIFYTLAALDPVLPARAPGKALASAARTFVVMMAAALCAISILFVPARTLWKQTTVRLTRDAK